MELLQNNIKDFVHRNRVATFCFVDELNQPHSFSCLCVFEENEVMLISKSSFGTRHEEYTRSSTMVSGTILPEKIDIAKLQGIQFRGNTLDETEITPEIENAYYRKYPFGRVIGGYVWAVKIMNMKFTDNTLVFGKKSHWTRSVPD